MLTAFDYGVIAIMVLSALRGAWRGLVSEVFSLIGWIVALLVAKRYAANLAPYVPANWPGGVLTQWLVAFVAIVAAVLIVSATANALLTRLANASGLRSVDRSLGLLFGLVRGVILVLVVAILAGLTELPQQAFWRAALLRPYVEDGERVVKPMLPPALAAYVHVDGAPAAAPPPAAGVAPL
ncbi:MAG: CvpA family protein [Janthinobacterium lividum]